MVYVFLVLPCEESIISLAVSGNFECASGVTNETSLSIVESSLKVVEEGSTTSCERGLSVWNGNSMYV